MLSKWEGERIKLRGIVSEMMRLSSISQWDTREFSDWRKVMKEGESALANASDEPMATARTEPRKTEKT